LEDLASFFASLAACFADFSLASLAFLSSFCLFAASFFAVISSAAVCGQATGLGSGVYIVEGES
jgi:hypothetical protein